LTVEITCPACRKVNLLLDCTESACVRCGCDLGNLAALARAARDHVRIASAFLRAGRPGDALGHAARSWALHRSPHAAALAALAAASSGDSRAIQQWRARWQERGPHLRA
jgi:hypothetical protein